MGKNGKKWGKNKKRGRNEKKGNLFIWAKPDILDTVNEDILLKNVSPIPVTNRGHLGLTDKDLKIVLSQMIGSASFNTFSNKSFFKGGS